MTSWVSQSVDVYETEIIGPFNEAHPGIEIPPQQVCANSGRKLVLLRAIGIGRCGLSAAFSVDAICVAEECRRDIQLSAQVVSSRLEMEQLHGHIQCHAVCPLRVQ